MSATLGHYEPTAMGRQTHVFNGAAAGALGRQLATQPALLGHGVPLGSDALTPGTATGGGSEQGRLTTARAVGVIIGGVTMPLPNSVTRSGVLMVVKG